MSLSQALFRNIEQVIEKYIDNVSKKFNLDKTELFALWSDEETKAIPRKRSKNSLSKQPAIDSVDLDDVSIERLHKCNKTELVALCKSKSLKCTGTKDVLINRLLGKEEASVSSGKKKTSPSKNEPKKEVTKEEKKQVKKVEKSTDIVKKLTADIPVIPIRRNAYGNLEHPQTGLVFDRKTECVIGKQKDDGTIIELTDDDIETCKKYKFKYAVPDNLEKNSLKNIKIEELDDNESDVEMDTKEQNDEEEVELEEDDEEYEYQEDME